MIFCGRFVHSKGVGLPAGRAVPCSDQYSVALAHSFSPEPASVWLTTSVLCPITLLLWSTFGVLRVTKTSEMPPLCNNTEPDLEEGSPIDTPSGYCKDAKGREALAVIAACARVFEGHGIHRISNHQASSLRFPLTPLYWKGSPP